MGLTYNVMPVPRQFFVDTNGAPYAGGKVYFWQSGGLSVPQDTYADAIGTVNANPVVLDSAGRAPIYLAPKAYAVELRDANGVQIWTQDPVYGYALTSDYGLNGGRLTLTTGVPETITDVTAAGTVFYTPFNGGAVALFDGTSVWAAFTFSEISIAVPAVANQMYDVFASQTAGVVSLNLVAWTNDTTRATAVVRQNGVLVKSGATTNRLLGSFRTTAVAGQTEDSFTKRYLSNVSNRVPRSLQRFETTDSWNYAVAAWQQANNSTANQVDCVVSIAEVFLRLTLRVGFSTAAGTKAFAVMLQEDGIVPSGFAAEQFGVATGNLNGYSFTTAALNKYPAVGRHFYAWIEDAVDASAVTVYGDNASQNFGPNSGISGWIDG